jgi:hypothetical protein
MSTKKIGSVEVRTFPLPPDGFNPLEASSEELRRHGFPRHPDPVKEPHAAAKWATAFQLYPNFTHITPEFKERPARHGPNHRTEKGTEGNVNATSSNWSGSVLFIGNGDHFTTVVGQWTVPHVLSPNPGDGVTYYSSQWLGLDGDGSDDVMQAGTESDSDGTYYAWWEWFPNFSVEISNFAVSPGDVITLSLCATDPSTASVSIGNLTSMVYTSFSFTAPPGVTLVGNCAEAVVERPGVGGGLAELPRYGEVYFDETTAYSATSVPFDIATGTPISMVADDGMTVISQPIFDYDSDMISCQYTGS